jgi:hypothetical protein
MPVEVFLNLFSQRPNPTWSLDAPQQEDLGRFLASLVRLPDRERPPTTGYRGFLVSDERVAGSPGLIRVYGGSVEIPGRGVFLDPDRKVERWLLESAGDAVDPEMRALVLRELEARPR